MQVAEQIAEGGLLLLRVPHAHGQAPAVSGDRVRRPRQATAGPALVP